MKKYLFIILIFLISTSAQSKNFKKVYFAGGCFWCMEESFDGVEGVLSTVSGYSGGHLKNPTYHDVVYKNKIDSFYSQTNSFMGKHYVEFFKYLYSNLGPIYDKLDNTDELGQNKLYNIINTLINNLPRNKIRVPVAKNTLKKIEYKRTTTLKKIIDKLRKEISQSSDDSAKKRLTDLIDDPKLIDRIRESLFNLKKLLKILGINI